MAESQINVLLRLTGAKQFQKDLRAVTSSFGDLSRSFDRVGQAAARLAANLARIGVAAGAAFGLAAREFAQFESDFTNVVTLLDESSFATGGLEAGIEGLKDGIFELGRESGQSFETLNQGLFDLISAGVAAADSIDTLRTAQELAIAGATDVATSVDGITTVLGAYSQENFTAQQISEAFFTAQKFGKTTIDELASSIGLVAATASASGVGFQELLAAVSAATTAGVDTNAAFTGARAAISNILKPTADAAAEAQRLGIEFSATGLRSRGLVGLLKDVTNSSNFTQDSFVRLFGSVQGLNFAQAVANNNFESTNGILRALNNESASAATFQAALAAQQETLGFNAGTLARNFQGLVVQIGEALSPAIIRLIQIFNELLDRLGPSIIGFFEDISENVAEFLERLQDDPDFFINLEISIRKTAATARNFFNKTLIPALRQASSLVVAATGSVLQLGNAFGFTNEETIAFTGALKILDDLGFIDLLKEGALAAGIFLFALTKLTNFLTGGALFGAIVRIRDAVIAGFAGPGVLGAIGRFIGFIGRIIFLFGRLVVLPVAIATAIAALFLKAQGSAQPFREAVERLQFLFANLPEVIGAALETVGAFFDLLSVRINNAVKLAVDRVRDTAAAIVQFFKDLPGEVAAFVSQVAADTIAGILQFIDNFFGNLINISDQTIATISNAIGQFIGSLAGAITAPFALIGEGIGVALDLIAGGFGQLIDTLGDGAQVLVDILTAPFKALITVAKEAFDFVKGFFARLRGETQQAQQDIQQQARQPLPPATVTIIQPPQFASGGIVRGPGTGTSDSILARLSNGEAVINAAAVRRLGSNFIHALNNGFIPGFASGGIAGGLNSSMVSPSAPTIGLVPVEARTGATGRPIVLNLPNGETIEAVTQDQDPARKLQRSLRQKNLNKPADRPFWY